MTLQKGLKKKEPFPKFLLMHTCFLIFTGLPGVFINTFLLGQTDDTNVVLAYNFVFFASGAVFMVIAVYTLRRLGPGLVAVVGIVGYNLLYLFLIILGERASEFHLLLGALTGFADGFYWLAYGHLLSAYTSVANRDKGMAAISIAGSIVNLIIPLFSGMLISKIGGTQGYLTVFGMAFGVAIVTGIVAVALPRPHIHDVAISYKKAISVSWKDKPLRYSLLGQATKGIREGAFLFVMSILLYQLVKSEMLIGFNTFLSAIASIIAYGLMHRFITGKNRVKWMKWGVITLFSCNVLVIFWMTPGGMIFYSVLNALCSGLVVNSAYTAFLDAMQVNEEATKHTPELLAMNEAGLVTGRCIGLLIMAGMNIITGASLLGQCLSLLILTATQFITLFFCHRGKIVENVVEETV